MKRRAAPNRQAAGVSSLFPYLDGLVCTMGALIVVLVVMARQPQSPKPADAQAPADDTLIMQRDDLEWRISQLRESREATKKLLADKQAELGHLEEHSRRLRDQLDDLAAARQRLSQTAVGDQREQAKLRSELDRLHYRVAGLRNEIGKLVEKARQSQQSYAVIPYRGPNETYRRPVYIECRADGIVLQPSGITLTERDFEIDAGQANPLASAVRAARDYFLGHALKGVGDTGSAYPLMIVRPDGVAAYFAARHEIESLGPDFGYELVAQDWSIEYPPADPMLVLAMKQAISEGRMRQAYLARSAPGLFYNRREVSFRAASHRGPLVVGGSGTGGGLHQPRSIFAKGRPGGVPGGADDAARSGGNTAGGGSPAGNPYLDALAQEGSGFGNGSGSQGPVAGAQRPGGARPAAQSGSGVRGIGGMGGIGIGSGNAGEPLAASSGRGPGVGDQGAETDDPSSPFGHKASGFGQQGSGYRIQGSGSNVSGGLAAQRGVSRNGSRQPPFANGGAAGTGGARGASAGTELASAEAARSDRPSDAQQGTASSAGRGDARAGGSGPSRGTSAGGPSRVGRLASSQGDANGADSSDRGGFGGGSPSGSSATRSGGSSGGSASAGSASAGGGSASVSGGSPGGGSVGSSMMQPGQMGMPMPTISMGAQPSTGQNSSDRKTTKRERNWANPDASTSNAPIERRIQIICDADHLTIMPEARRSGMKVIKLGTHTEDSLDELASAVWDRIDSWGTAGRGMYWRPKLVMTIEPGGQHRYTELQSLLADSGFDVHGRPRTVRRR